MRKVIVLLVLSSFCLAFYDQKKEDASIPEKSFERPWEEKGKSRLRISQTYRVGQKERKLNMEHNQKLADFLSGYWREVVDINKGEVSLYHFTGKKIKTLIEKSSATHRGIMYVESEELPVFRLIKISREDGKVTKKQYEYCTGEGAYMYMPEPPFSNLVTYSTFKFNAKEPLSQTVWFYYLRTVGQWNDFRWSLTRLDPLHSMNRITEGEYEAIKRIMENFTVDYLLEALKDKDVTSRKYAAEFLIAKRDPQIVEPLIAALMDEDKNVRGFAAKALGEIKDKKAVEPLIVVLNDDDTVVRRNAAEALAKMRDPRAAESLLLALKDTDRDIRLSARTALNAIKTSIPVEILTEGLKNENEAVRLFSVQALNGIKDPSAVESLIFALNDEDSGIRAEAEKAILNIGIQALDSLSDFLEDENVAIRRAVTIVIGKIKDQKSVEHLIVALGDDDEVVRLKAKDALVKLRLPAIRPLVTALKDENDQVRMCACEILGSINFFVAIEPLFNTLLDRNPAVREQAALALKKLTGQDFGQDQKKWLRWWKKVNKK